MRIGIFSGSFDPIHAGHIAFALQAIEAANLGKLYFCPEAKPRVNNDGQKPGISHIAHRLELIKLATRAHPKLDLLELPDKQFTVAQTMPRLKRIFKGDELFFICGSDMLEHMPQWALIEKLLTNFGLIVGIRQSSDSAAVNKMLERLPVPPKSINIIASAEPNISARQIRQAIGDQQKPVGLLASTAKYIDKNWLYARPPK